VLAILLLVFMPLPLLQVGSELVERSTCLGVGLLREFMLMSALPHDFPFDGEGFEIGLGLLLLAFEVGMA
jgi:hypothetical protein